MTKRGGGSGDVPPPRLCGVEGCGEKHKAKGFCKKHYDQRTKTVPADQRKHAIRSERDSFVAAALASSTDECILWPFGKDTGGYSQYVTRETATVAAHAHVCVVVHGPKPAPDHEVRHLCNVRACINPRHVVWGTRKENSADRVAYGTAPRGGANPRARLTESDVLEIRQRAAAGEIKVALAKEYGVSPATVSHIVHRRSWKHVR